MHKLSVFITLMTSRFFSHSRSSLPLQEYVNSLQMKYNKLLVRNRPIPIGLSFIYYTCIDQHIHSDTTDVGSIFSHK